MTPQECATIQFKVIGVIFDEFKPAVRKIFFPPFKAVQARSERSRPSLDEFRLEVSSCTYSNWHKQAARLNFAFDEMPVGTVLQQGNKRFRKVSAKGLEWEYRLEHSRVNRLGRLVDESAVGRTGGTFGMEICFPGSKPDPAWREYLIRQAYRMLYPD
jgi:hypothetical protein